MAMCSLDPRTGGTCANIIANKFCSYVVAYVQLILWISAFFILVFNPSSVSNVVQNADTTSMVITGFVSLFCIIISVVLLLGLHKDRRLYVKAYCIYIVVYLVLMALGFFVNIFVQPKKMGFRGFFSMVLSFLMNLFFFFVVRCYYLIKYCNGSNQLVTNQPEV
ncbi:unnamed protein product [Arctia plantaginis]|uniref:Uncharacterized protein n=1 Tax=Arctia plantaginis TaxID=874455 RepID=A0A8S0Z4W4_ARCPL|nr:unnamed protein product [Arctia plantaginis]CAB3228268.1 unnamed protein product [Arctia plantaginis]